MGYGFCKELMKSLYIYHHLGLGDHIVCNGLIREIIKYGEYFRYNILTKPRNKESVSFMYRDLENVCTVEIENDCYSSEILKNVCYQKIGFSPPNHDSSWDQLFYEQCHIPFKYRWDSFYIRRDPDREQSLSIKLNAEKESYILIHNKASDNIDGIDYSYINNTIKHIYVENLTNNMFDYMGLIENSSEIHCVSSAFQVLIDSLDLKIPLFFHNTKHIRPNSDHKLRLDWIRV